MKKFTDPTTLKSLVLSLVVVGALGSARLSMAAPTYYWVIGSDRKLHNQDLSDPWLWGNTVAGSVTSLDPAGTFIFRWDFTEPIVTSESVSWGAISFAQNSSASFSGTLDLTQTNALGEVSGYASVLANGKLNIGAGGGTASLNLTAGTLGVSRTPSQNPAIWMGDGNANGGTSSLTISGPNAVFQTAYAQRTVVGQSHPMAVTVRDGALYSGNFFIGQYGGTSRLQRESGLLVTGEGSRLVVPAENTAELVVGSTSGGSSLVISNKATMTVSAALDVRLGSPINGVSPGTHNRFVVTDGATFSGVGGVWAGINSSSNLFEVSGGARATVGGIIRCSNGGLQGVHIYGNRMLFKGSGTVVAANGGLYGGYFGDHETSLTVTDGATLNVAAGKTFTIGNSSCSDGAFEVSNCATVNVAKAESGQPRFLIGGSDSPRNRVVIDNAVFNASGISCGMGFHATAVDCSLALRNGAAVTLGDMYLGDYADRSTLTVADSTLKCATLNFGLTGGKDHVFSLSGAAARIVTGTFQLAQPTTWNFTLPETEPDEPILTCYVFHVKQPSVLNVTATELSVKKKVRLLHSTGIDIADEALANLTVNLPDGYRLVRSQDKRDLIVKPDVGFMLLFR